ISLWCCTITICGLYHSQSVIHRSSRRVGATWFTHRSDVSPEEQQDARHQAMDVALMFGLSFQRIYGWLPPAVPELEGLSIRLTCLRGTDSRYEG
ncbi:unnamed protein product, partial [Mycena citricolor]